VRSVDRAAQRFVEGLLKNAGLFLCAIRLLDTDRRTPAFRAELQSAISEAEARQERLRARLDKMEGTT